MIRLLGISGKKGVGKTTLATQLPATVISLATPLKQFLVDVLGCDEAAIRGNKDAPSPVTMRGWCYATLGDAYDPVRPDRPLTHRELMQWFGGFVRTLRPDAWIQAALRKAANCHRCVIDDVRYVNEAEAIVAAGGVVVRLDGVDSGDRHASETELDDWTGFALRISRSDAKLLEAVKGVTGW